MSENNPSARNLVGKFEGTNIETYSTIWNCYICTTLILKESAIEPHLKRCMANEERNREARRQNSIKTGLPLDKKKVYACEICYQVVNRKADLVKHMKHHSSEA